VIDAPVIPDEEGIIDGGQVISPALKAAEFRAVQV
jgi:hypothetical protein